MNEHDLLDAIGKLPDAAVNKYALPETGGQDNEMPERAAGKERIKMKQTSEKAKSPVRISRLGIAAAVALCIGLNGALIYGISQMRKAPGMTPGMASPDTVDRDKLYISEWVAMPTAVGLQFFNQTEETYAMPMAVAVLQEGEQVTSAAYDVLPDHDTPDLLPGAQDYMVYSFQQIPAGSYTLMTYADTEMTVPSVFGSIDFEISTEFDDCLWLPDVKGMKWDTAEKLLQDYHPDDYDITFDVQYTTTQDQDMEEGDVIYCWNTFDKSESEDDGLMLKAMFDRYGYWIRRGGVYEIKVCTNGTGSVHIPDIVGWDFEKAKTTLLGLGMYVDKRTAYSSEVEAGKVISADVEGREIGSSGITAEPQQYVRVTVSCGELPDTVIVPDFTGMTWEQAREMAESLKLVAGMKEVADPSAPDTVLSQDIAPGEEVAEGTPVTLEIARDGAFSTVRMTFRVPQGYSGKYHIVLKSDSGILLVAGGPFEPEKSAGTTSLTVEGTVDDMEVKAYLKNEDAGVQYPIGTYMLHFPTESYETITEDIEAAFRNTQL